MKSNVINTRMLFSQAFIACPAQQRSERFAEITPNEDDFVCVIVGVGACDRWVQG
jgi:hypothetical protein